MPHIRSLLRHRTSRIAGAATLTAAVFALGIATAPAARAEQSVTCETLESFPGAITTTTIGSSTVQGAAAPASTGNAPVPGIAAPATVGGPSAPVTTAAGTTTARTLRPGLLPTPKTERCTITEPAVSAREQFYPVPLHPNDRVEILAGGCVQAGGQGKTWKRYVDPQGPGSDHLYHGLIRLPGGTPTRLQAVNNSTVTIPTTAQPGFLALGYEDDVYDDNGYWGKDAGTGNQCATESNAWVQLVITHAAAVTPIAHPPAYTFRLDAFQILDTMARHEDSDTLCITATTGNGSGSAFPTAQAPAAAPYAQTRCAAVGDLNNGTYAKGWEVGPFSVDPTTPVVFTYQIVNHGGDSAFVSGLQTVVKDAAIAFATYETGSTSVGTAVGSAVQTVEKVVFANCDGVVLSDGVKLSGADLASYTAGNVRYSETRSYVGPETPTGCGANARYNVTWSLAPWVATAPPPVHLQ